MSTPEEQVFSTNQLFRGLSAAELEDVHRIPTLVSYDAGAVIFDEGWTDDHLYLIASGVVRISKRGRGGEQETLAYLEAGEFFGDMAAFDPAPRSARATAVQDVRLGRVDREGLARLLKVAPLPIAENLSRRNIQRLRDTDTHLIREVLEAERLSLIGSMAGTIIHDLKNPIGIVRGVATLLEEHEDSQLTRWAAMLHRASDRMLDMVQDILEFARGNTALTVSPVPIEALVDELDEQLLRGASQKGIKVETQINYSEPLWIDRARFSRVLLNVVKNAIEAMPNGGLLCLSVEPRGDEVCFSITDSGIGIPEHLLARVFEPFVTHGKSNGTGLGMAIAKSVVDAHGGRIAVESTPGEGTRFEITVPSRKSD